MTLLGKVILELALGAVYVHFGAFMVLGRADRLPAVERLRLPRGLELACGIVALAAGVALLVGIGFPVAGLAGAALAAVVLAVALISFLRPRESPFPRVFAALALLGLVVLVWLMHWPDRPLLPWLPG